MSHKATVWAIQQRGLKPATKIVLWFLCDRHNPDFGCFPTQARLADDAEMSISALNEHLAKLQELRLIHRVRAQDPHTHKRLATRYILGFEDGFPPEPTPETGDGLSGTEEDHDDNPSPESGHGAISGFPAKPSPDFAQSHLRNPEINLVREPLSKPVKEEEDAQARDSDFDRFFAELLTALGFAANASLPAWWQGSPA
ncbi:MAG: helix-turn-helix domain-containing protein, partial [Cypionkella sp.]|nr:helix-turn-helix domain-containing protein [Cypionkella sp.]